MLSLIVRISITPIVQSSFAIDANHDDALVVPVRYANPKETSIIKLPRRNGGIYCNQPVC